ncbi:MAG: sugar ABC transporter permease [Clostridiaceae bacterium]|nr:sugar ABC transporter permease [Clostridiaceae bacterium]
MRAEKKEALTAMVFIAPWVVGFLVFTLYPILSSLYYSMTNYNVLNPPSFIGFENYINLLKDKVYLKSLTNTLYMIVIGGTITIIVSLIVSIIMDNRKLRGISLFRVFFFMPTLVPTVIACVLWIWMLQPTTGVVNTLLGYLGITGPGWIASPTWSKPAMILMMIWACGNIIIVNMAGLQDIPQSMYESASIDGANFFQKVRTITIPLLRPVILYNSVTLIINILQWFAEPLIMTEGGPDSSTLFYSLYLYQNAFQFFKMGYASAMAWIMLIIALALIIFLLKFLKFGESE